MYVSMYVGVSCEYCFRIYTFFTEKIYAFIDQSFFSKGMLMYVLYVWRLLPQASSTESEYGDLLGGVSFAQRKKLQAAKESQTVVQVRLEKTI